ncbi:Uncharacterised protein [BD1-7 clade bacterium]|uniref:Pvc16 N-terminal domain-containing protein n=1 Tax=BD1-7 clade bacterium TaxID=2029982 RepID=A0A5S9QMI4_9GAMM|nr:Uncharacterised protein [BD1-7 clade bacterium]
MIYESLSFLSTEIQIFLARKGNLSSEEGLIGLSHVVYEQGKLAIEKDTLGAAVINIEEERTNRPSLPRAVKQADNSIAYQNPVIDLNLSVLFVANFSDYTQALKAISNVIGFFQSNSVFAPDTFPALDARIGKLVCELQSLELEQLSYLWGTLGYSYMPSVLYRVRLVTIEENTILSGGAAVSGLAVDAGGA